VAFAATESRTFFRLLAAAAATLLWAAAAQAAPVAVRIREGASHGFVDFFAGNTRIASGELVQFPRDKGRLENRLTIGFDDGSFYEETLTFSQEQVFQLHTYHLVQRGPSFPEAMEVSFEDTGTYDARVTKAGKKEETDEGHVEVPADVYNGLSSTLLKNLGPGESAEVHTLAFTPKPRLLDAKLMPQGESHFVLGSARHAVTKYRVALHVAGLAGIAARLIGKDPPDIYYWITVGPAPTFVRFEGPLSADGPVWRAELSGPRWVR
jgi:hypothetical protein